MSESWEGRGLGKVLCGRGQALGPGRVRWGWGRGGHVRMRLKIERLSHGALFL